MQCTHLNVTTKIAWLPLSVPPLYHFRHKLRDISRPRFPNNTLGFLIQPHGYSPRGLPHLQLRHVVGRQYPIYGLLRPYPCLRHYLLYAMLPPTIKPYHFLFLLYAYHFLFVTNSAALRNDAARCSASVSPSIINRQRGSLRLYRHKRSSASLYS